MPVRSPARRARLACLAGAVLLYGGFSAPAPADPGWAEAAIGVLLAVAVGPVRGAVIVAGGGLAAGARRGWATAGTLALAWLLWVPLLGGLAADWAPADIVRDVVPLLFLFLPLLLSDLADPAAAPRAGQGSAAVRLAYALAAAGVLLAARFFLITHVPVGSVRPTVPSDGLLYLANAPAVLFAAILLPLLAWEKLERPSPSRVLASLALLAGGLVALAALATTLQRGKLAAAVLAFALYLGWRCRRDARVALALPALVLGLGLALGDRLGGLVELLALKSRLVGFNQHDAELFAAADLAGQSLGRALFGIGWGALIDSPAVPGMAVSYLHALPLYILVKAGLLGLVAIGAWLGGFVPVLVRLGARQPGLALAIAAPVLVGALIQPSFKYLDYGLLLALLMIAAPSTRTEASSCHSGRGRT